MHKYRLVAKKGEGTFSEVLKAQCVKNGKYVAIKCMKNHFDSLDQVNSLREIQALRRLSPHANIIKLLEVLYDQPTGRLALVFELMDMNVYELIRGRRHYVAEERVKSYMYQLMKSMDHMHRNGIFHRDIKPENILIMDDCLKLADFGSCRGIYSKQPYTEYISTRWYRAPECLLTDGYYNYKMDMWGVGCVFFEIVSLFPLFPGQNELDQIQKIHNIIGTPPPDLLAKLKRHSHHVDFSFPAKEGTGIAKLIPHCSPECIELITKLLAYNPDDRLSARQALRHPYFRELREQEKRQRALLAPDAASSHLYSEAEKRQMGTPPDGHSAITTPDTSRRAEAAAASTSSALPSISGATKPAVKESGTWDDRDCDADDEGITASTSSTHLPNLNKLDSGTIPDDADTSSQLPPIGSLSISKKSQPAPQPLSLQQSAAQAISRKPQVQPSFPAASGSYQTYPSPGQQNQYPGAPSMLSMSGQHAGSTTTNKLPRTGGQRPSYSSLGITGGNKLAPVTKPSQLQGQPSVTGITGVNKYKGLQSGKVKSYVSPYSQRAGQQP